MNTSIDLELGEVISISSLIKNHLKELTDLQLSFVSRNEWTVVKKLEVMIEKNLVILNKLSLAITPEELAYQNR